MAHEKSLTERALKGDHDAIDTVLKDNRMIDLCGLVSITSDNIIKQTAGNPVYEEAFRRKLDLLRTELNATTPLEKLLAERIVCCWLHLHTLEYRLTLQTDMSVQLHYERCISQANRRYLASIRTLATVRKLGVPAILQQITVTSGQEIRRLTSAVALA